jgi:DNA invertase Pin-like site-specific DNA recombinase
MAMRVRLQPLPQIAAIYTRVSTKEQAEDGKSSPQTQQDGCRLWASTNGFAVSESFIYHDSHTGEELWERPALMRLLDAAKTRQFAIVVFHSTDRLSRINNHVNFVIELLEREGVAVACVTEPIDTSMQGQMTRFAYGIAGQIESDRRKERTMRAVRDRALSGKLIPSNKATYGYQYGPEKDQTGRLTKERLVVDPLTAPIVVRIFEDIAAGKSLRAVALALTQEGVPTPLALEHGRWNPVTIKQIVTLSSYWGQPVAFRQQVVPVARELRPFYAKRTRKIDRPEAERIPLPPGVVPAIVSVELALAAQARLARNRQLNARNNSENPHPALLRGGLAVCGYCGWAVRASHIPPSTRRDGSVSKHRWVYICHNTGIKGACRKHACETHLLDDAVWAKVGQLLRDPHIIQHEVEMMDAEEAPGTDALAVIEQRLAGVNRRTANLLRLAQLADDPEQTAQLHEDLTKLAEEKQGIEQERTAAMRHYARWHDKQQGLEQALDWSARVSRNLDTWTYDQRRAFLLTLDTRVELFDAKAKDRALLHVTLPVSGQSAAVPLFDGNDSVNTSTRAFWPSRSSGGVPGEVWRI